MTENPLASQYTRKIKSLCKQYGVGWHVIYSKRKRMNKYALWSSSTANASIRTINVPSIHGPDSLKIFATALHELGHCIDFQCLSPEEQQLDIQKTIASNEYKRSISLYLLTKEFIAWDIAKSLAGKLWTAELSKFRYFILSEWITHYNRDHKRKKSVKKFSRPIFFGTTIPVKKVT